MIDYSKWSAFISTLSNEEIRSQLADLFTFAVEYKALIEEELSGRLDGDRETPSENHSSIEGVQLDFRVMNRIKSIIDSLNSDQLLEEMKNLDDYLSSADPAMASDYQEKIYAQEVCEQKYFDLFGQEPVICPNCLAYLTPEQRFCGKCGTRFVK